MAKQIFIAIESGASEVDGETLVFKKNITTVEEGHALLDQVPEYFAPIDREVHYETTTKTREPATPRKGK